MLNNTLGLWKKPVMSDEIHTQLKQKIKYKTYKSFNTGCTLL